MLWGSRRRSRTPFAAKSPRIFVTRFRTDFRSSYFRRSPRLQRAASFKTLPAVHTNFLWRSELTITSSTSFCDGRFASTSVQILILIVPLLEWLLQESNPRGLIPSAGCASHRRPARCSLCLPGGVCREREHWLRSLLQAVGPSRWFRRG